MDRNVDAIAAKGLSSPPYDLALVVFIYINRGFILVYISCLVYVTMALLVTPTLLMMLLFPDATWAKNPPNKLAPREFNISSAQGFVVIVRPFNEKQI